MPNLRVLLLVLFNIHYLLYGQEVGVDSIQVGNLKHTVSAEWEVPVQFAVQYEYNFTTKVSGYLQTGLLRKPNSSIILSTIEAFGTDDMVMDLIENAFQSGLVFEEGVNYKFKRNYVGLFFQQVILSGEETPTNIVEVLLNEDLNTFPRRRGRNGPLERTLTLNSNLFQVGFHLGRTFTLQSDFHLFTEFGFSFNVSSSSSLDSPQLELSALDSEIDELLDDTYSSYAYIPSLSFGIAKRF